MNIKENVIRILKEQFNVSVDINGLSEEALLLYIDELDKGIFSPGLLRTLPDPVVFQTFSYEEESEWIIGIAFANNKGTDYPLYFVCLKDGEKVYEKVLSKGFESND